MKRVKLEENKFRNYIEKYVEITLSIVGCPIFWLIVGISIVLLFAGEK